MIDVCGAPEYLLLVELTDLASELAGRFPDIEVVSGAPCRVEEDVVGLGDRYEACCGTRLLVAAWVVPAGQTKESLVNLVAAGNAGDSESHIVVSYHP